MPRYPGSNVTYAIGPGAPTPAVRILLIANIVLFFMNVIVDEMTLRLGLSPQLVFRDFAVWQPITYMFLHSTRGLSHILFNMLALWMFGTELERTWGTRFFTKYYFITGIGAAASTLLLSLVIPDIYHSTTVGASGAIYGLLIAYAMYFPHRVIYYIIFPIPARVFVAIMGFIALWSSVSGSSGGVAHIAHLGGLVVGYLYLKSLRGGPLNHVKYYYLRWKMGRARNRFDVYSGGRPSNDDDWKSEWKKHIH